VINWKCISLTEGVHTVVVLWRVIQKGAEGTC